MRYAAPWAAAPEQVAARYSVVVEQDSPRVGGCQAGRREIRVPVR